MFPKNIDLFYNFLFESPNIQCRFYGRTTSCIQWVCYV